MTSRTMTTLWILFTLTGYGLTSNFSQPCGPTDCYEATHCDYSPYRGDVFPVNLDVGGTTGHVAYCETDGSKVWTSLLTRNRELLVSEVNFARGRAHYLTGFGDSRNSWLGARALLSTLGKGGAEGRGVRKASAGRYRVRLLINGRETAVCYDFDVAGESDGFRVKFANCEGRHASLLLHANGRTLSGDCGSAATFWWFDEHCSHSPTAKITADIGLPGVGRVNSLVLQYRRSGEQHCPGQCGDNGFCKQASEGGRECICDGGFTGSRCEIRTDCSRVTKGQEICLNGGVCRENGRCVCLDGFHGANCAIAKECLYECEHGLCDTDKGICACESGFRGDRCNARTAYLEGETRVKFDTESSSLLANRLKKTFQKFGSFGISFITGFLIITILMVVTTKLKKDSKDSIDTAQPIRHYPGWDGEAKHPLRRGTREILTMEQFYLKRDINLDAIHLAKGTSNIDSD